MAVPNLLPAVRWLVGWSTTISQSAILDSTSTVAQIGCVKLLDGAFSGGGLRRRRVLALILPPCWLRATNAPMISETDILWWCALNSAVGLTDIRAVCDIGQQELIRSDEAAYLKAAQTFALVCGEPDADIVSCHSSADLWRAVGRRIVSIDLVGSGDDFRRLDLNVEGAPRDLAGEFDLVTNTGTTEHIFNQPNCFRVIHDLAKVRGVMAHALPAAGYANHGFFHYTVKFFTALASANDYHCLDAWLSVDEATGPLAPDLVAFLDATDHQMFKDVRGSVLHPLAGGYCAHRYRASDAGLYVFLRKNFDKPFRLPVDVPVLP